MHKLKVQWDIIHSHEQRRSTAGYEERTELSLYNPGESLPEIDGSLGLWSG